MNIPEGETSQSRTTRAVAPCTVIGVCLKQTNQADIMTETHQGKTHRLISDWQCLLPFDSTIQSTIQSFINL